MLERNRKTITLSAFKWHHKLPLGYIRFWVNTNFMQLMFEFHLCSTGKKEQKVHNQRQYKLHVDVSWRYRTIHLRENTSLFWLLVPSGFCNWLHTQAQLTRKINGCKCHTQGQFLLKVNSTITREPYTVFLQTLRKALWKRPSQHLSTGEGTDQAASRETLQPNTRTILNFTEDHESDRREPQMHPVFFTFSCILSDRYLNQRPQGAAWKRFYTEHEGIYWKTLCLSFSL